MSFFYILLSIVWVVRILNHYFKTEEKSIPQFQCNNNELEQPLLNSSYIILGIENTTRINPTVIDRAYYNQLAFSSEDEKLGYKQKYSLQDFKAARLYLSDYYNYVAYLN